MRFDPYFLGLCLGLLPIACGNSTTTTTAIVRPELVSVLPGDFMGQVTCNDDPDAGADEAQSFVATLFDVSLAEDGGVPDQLGSPLPGNALPSSPATTCRFPATFSFVVLDHRYIARVDAYDVPAAALTAFAPGSPLQLDSSGARVAPRWAANCFGYQPTPDPDAGFDAGIPLAVGGAAGAHVGVTSYDALTESPHNCQLGLVDPSTLPNDRDLAK